MRAEPLPPGQALQGQPHGQRTGSEVLPPALGGQRVAWKEAWAGW